jgi:hypothetical protein
MQERRRERATRDEGASLAEMSELPHRPPVRDELIYHRIRGWNIFEIYNYSKGEVAVESQTAAQRLTGLHLIR